MAPAAWRRSIWPVTAVWCLTSGASVALGGPASTPTTGTLHQLHVSHEGTRVVVSLVADRPLASRLQKVTAEGLPPRVFVDLPAIAPEVARVTEVNAGLVSRVRVGLHSSMPPTTRVVLDLVDQASGILSGPVRTRLERASSGRELRVVVEWAPPDGNQLYDAWFATAADVINRQLSVLSKHGSDVTVGGWPLVLSALQQTTAPESRRSAHRLLATSGHLVRAALTGNAVATGERSAALAGARLLLDKAQAVEAEDQVAGRPPLVAVVDGRLSVDADDVDLGALLRAIARQASLTVHGYTAYENRVSAHLDNVLLERGLREILRGRRYGLLTTRWGGGLLLDRPASPASDSTPRRLVSTSVLPSSPLPPASPAVRFNDQTTNALAVVLRHHDVSVRLQAIEMLALVGGDQAAQLLEYSWAGDRSAKVRDAAWSSLEQLLGPDGASN